ncbi:MAG: class I SAM-dependent methyltransferase [Porphyromonadaceae bacterium]|nr:class I SAM-dependent methyltransferase [Porphyromonadaceae bacterium]
MKIGTCPISGSSSSIKFFDLGNVPLVNNLCNTKEDSLQCQKFPLSVQFFPESKLTALTEVVDKNELFLNYLYRSGVNKPYLDHCSKMYDFLSRKIILGINDVVVDIGGNDGSLLAEFRRENRNPHYINIDCSKSFIEDNKKLGIDYINEFFGENTRLLFKAQLITSTNVFQHTESIRSFVRGIERNLSNEGIWCLEFPYILTTLANDNYDQVYHEHVYYYCLQNIIDLLDQENMRVISVSYHDMHAGTLRVLSVKKSSRRQSDSTILSFLNLEKTLTEEYVIKWGKRAQEKIEELKKFINSLSDNNYSIFGFGAAAKGCVFLNSCKINADIMPFIIDDTPFKQGKFVPGTGIKIISRDILKNSQPDYILILAHNFKDYIIDSLKNLYHGKYIVMFPDIRIL